MDFKDSKGADEVAVAAYWLATVEDDRAESAPPPAPVKPEGQR